MVRIYIEYREEEEDAELLLPGGWFFDPAEKEDDGVEDGDVRLEEDILGEEVGHVEAEEGEEKTVRHR